MPVGQTLKSNTILQTIQSTAEVSKLSGKGQIGNILGFTGHAVPCANCRTLVV